MHKDTEKKINDFINILMEINNGVLPFSLNTILNSESMRNKYIQYSNCSYYASLAKMYFISPNGKVIDEVRELFNDKGFDIETFNNQHFIRTEKGIINL
jgi:hypothetical protein